MKATVKQIFDSIQDLNATGTTVSSMGRFVTAQAEESAEKRQREVLAYLTEGTLAHKILSDARNMSFTVKQLWVIAYALEKTSYAENLAPAKVESKKDKKRRMATYTMPPRLSEMN